MNIPQEKYFLKLREENTFFVVHKYQTLCPGICWGAINVISNNKCERSNVENIISSPVKVPLGRGRNIKKAVQEEVSTFPLKGIPNNISK